MIQQEQRRKAVGEMTGLKLSYSQPIVMPDGLVETLWISERAEEKFKELDKLVKSIDEGNHGKR